ncbi:ATP-dependent DNA ligase [Fictibacillus sp. WQ 8-8]|uniref:ATP-dependent DNA ligase n=1 Tax=Fictibacillus sp. WQ 8-8 TaxID=2938788 RepID=UPI00210991BC|nr:RNA ligase family protein [Fictibacillus sp. WQ 8-8]MCQ6267771.1 ATP-dependent DNA ligase [Fictibacillus sp. WQ 8-8]
MFINPMLLHKSEPFSDPKWIFEPKMDGIRLLFSKINNNVQLYTRHNHNVTERFPELLKIPVHNDVILDGELICYDPEQNKVDFERCMERFMTRRPQKRQQLEVHYVVFDILHYDGMDVRHLPLIKRKEILDSVIEDTGYISKIKYVPNEGERYFEAIKQMDLEGMVAKRKDSPYESKRSAKWLKVINWKYVDVYITGFKKKELGWLCSVKEGDRLKSVGILDLGTTPESKEAFYRVAKSIRIEENEDVVFLEPKIQAKVKIRNWTRKGMLRSPSFVGFTL